jgi:hypothetical protein
LERINADVLRLAKERDPSSLGVLEKALAPFDWKAVPLPREGKGKGKAKMAKTEASKMKDVFSLLKTS